MDYLKKIKFSCCFQLDFNNQWRYASTWLIASYTSRTIVNKKPLPHFGGSGLRRINIPTRYSCAPVPFPAGTG